MADGREILLTTLLDLLVELRIKGVSVLLGGGYGLYLKQTYLAENNIPTLVDLDLWPPARATQDLDIFLPAELIVDPILIQMVPPVLQQLGCRVIEGREYYQFKRSLPNGQEVKIDLLAPLPDESLAAGGHVKVEADRVKPRPRIPLHARLTREAIALPQSPVSFPIRGTRSDGTPAEEVVHIPQGFTYLLMKLFAFRDFLSASQDGLQLDSKRRAAGRAVIHAVDSYRIVAMLTEGEFAEVRRLAECCRPNECVQEACRIVAEQFGTIESPGSLRIRGEVGRADMAAFLSLLSELFPPTGA